MYISFVEKEAMVTVVLLGKALAESIVWKRLDKSQVLAGYIPLFDALTLKRTSTALVSLHSGRCGAATA